MAQLLVSVLLVVVLTPAAAIRVQERAEQMDGYYHTFAGEPCYPPPCPGYVGDALRSTFRHNTLINGIRAATERSEMQAFIPAGSSGSASSSTHVGTGVGADGSSLGANVAAALGHSAGSHSVPAANSVSFVGRPDYGGFSYIESAPVYPKWVDQNKAVKINGVFPRMGGKFGRFKLSNPPVRPLPFSLANGCGSGGPCAKKQFSIEWTTESFRKVSKHLRKMRVALLLHDNWVAEATPVALNIRRHIDEVRRWQSDLQAELARLLESKGRAEDKLRADRDFIVADEKRQIEQRREALRAREQAAHAHAAEHRNVEVPLHL